MKTLATLSPVEGGKKKNQGSQCCFYPRRGETSASKEMAPEGAWLGRMSRTGFLLQPCFARTGVGHGAGPREKSDKKHSRREGWKKQRNSSIVVSPRFAVRPGPRLFVFCRQPKSTAMEDAECPSGIPGQIKERTCRGCGFLGVPSAPSASHWKHSTYGNCSFAV